MWRPARRGKADSRLLAVLTPMTLSITRAGRTAIPDNDSAWQRLQTTFEE